MSDFAGRTIGFIGLGLMGAPMCRNLMKAGGQLVVTNRSEAPRRKMQEEGATAVDTPAAVAARADIIVLMVADTLAVEAVLSGPGGALETLRPGTLFIDMGTTSMVATRGFAKAVEKRLEGAPVGAPGFQEITAFFIHTDRVHWREIDNCPCVVGKDKIFVAMTATFYFDPAAMSCNGLLKRFFNARGGITHKHHLAIRSEPAPVKALKEAGKANVSTFNIQFQVVVTIHLLLSCTV